MHVLVSVNRLKEGQQTTNVEALHDEDGEIEYGLSLGERVYLFLSGNHLAPAIDEIGARF